MDDNNSNNRRPGIVIINKEDKNCFIVDIAIPGDSRLNEKEGEKIGKYQDLQREIMRMWNLKSAQVIPIIIVGALGGVTKELGDSVGKLSITLATAFLQKTALLGTARIRRKVLDT